MANIEVYPDGTLLFKSKRYRCAVGKNGMRADKKEGDWATPTGCFSVRKVFYRPDKFKNSPQTVFAAQPLSPDDGWSDDANLSEYNSFVKLPYNGSCEKLWRSDDLYDVIVVLGYNDNPPVAGKGSAVFMHIARENYAPTAGCIAVSREDMLNLLKNLDSSTQICIYESQNRDSLPR